MFYAAAEAAVKRPAADAVICFNIAGVFAGVPSVQLHQKRPLAGDVYPRRGTAGARTGLGAILPEAVVVKDRADSSYL